MINRIKKIEPKKIVIAFLVIYFTLFSLTVSLKHLSMQTALFDFSLEAQVIRKTAEGNLFASGVEVPNYLGDHFSPLPVVLSAVVYKVIPSDFTILLLQPLLVVIGLWYFYKLCIYYKLKPHIAILFTVLMGFVPGIQCAVIFDYHPIMYAFPILLAAIYYDKKGKLLLSLGLFFLACLVKEDVGLFVAGYGILQILEKRKIGILLTILGIGIAYASMFYIIPGIRGEESDSLMRYSQFGTNGVEIVKNIVLKPLDTISYLLTLRNLGYLLILFTPFLFIPLIKYKEFIFLFLPSYAVNIFSSFQNQTDGKHYYDILITIALGYMLILGWKKLENSIKLKDKFKTIAKLSIILLIVILPFWKLYPDMNRILGNNFSEYFEIGRIIDRNFRKSDIIGVSNYAGAHLSKFDNVYIVYPDWTPNIKVTYDYILLYKPEIPGNFLEDNALKFQEYNIAYNSDKFILLRKVGY
ncbi:MAG: DUF2079 domain-containing protein [bacterium]